MRRDDYHRMKTWQNECRHVRRPVATTVPGRALRVRASGNIPPQVVRFNKHDKDSVTKSLQSISTVMLLSLALTHV